MEIANYKAFVRGRSSGSSPVPSAAGSSAYSVLQRTAGRRECGRGKEDGTWRKVKVIRFDRTFPALNGLGWTWALKSILISIKQASNEAIAVLGKGAWLPIAIAINYFYEEKSSKEREDVAPGLAAVDLSPHILRYHLQDKLSTAQLGSLPSRRKKIF
uniref:Uncharacterized protein n=1 Tax=Oryza rufipogon TaxID=4529 RepID=A0A0E0NQB1_ORYRU